MFQSAEVHFEVHLKMEKSLPNPIALAPSYNIRNMARAGRAEREKKKKQETQTLTEWRQLQMSK